VADVEAVPLVAFERFGRILCLIGRRRRCWEALLTRRVVTGALRMWRVVVVALLTRRVVTGRQPGRMPNREWLSFGMRLNQQPAKPLGLRKDEVSDLLRWQVG
jgi:hypothetical protein